MSTWKDIKKDIKRTTRKVIHKTDELLEEASLSIQQKRIEDRLAEAYEKLGRVSYRFLADEDGANLNKEEVRVASETVDRYRRELCEIKAKIRRFKEKGASDDRESEGCDAES